MDRVQHPNRSTIQDAPNENHFYNYLYIKVRNWVEAYASLLKAKSNWIWREVLQIEQLTTVDWIGELLCFVFCYDTFILGQVGSEKNRRGEREFSKLRRENLSRFSSKSNLFFFFLFGLISSNPSLQRPIMCPIFYKFIKPRSPSSPLRHAQALDGKHLHRRFLHNIFEIWAFSITFRS